MGKHTVELTTETERVRWETGPATSDYYRCKILRGQRHGFRFFNYLQTQGVAYAHL